MGNADVTEDDCGAVAERGKGEAAKRKRGMWRGERMWEFL